MSDTTRPDPEQPRPGDSPDRAGPQGAAEAPEAVPSDLAASDSPYRNLWVPLVVVPFLLVGVIVLVYVFFGAIAGSDATMASNLERVLNGGPNSSKQALASLSAQLVENAQAEAEGEPPKHEFPGDFRDRLESAWDQLADGQDHHAKMVVASALSQFGDPAARERLESLLEIGDKEDPDGSSRFLVLAALGWLQDPAAVPAVTPFLSHPLSVLRGGAAGALQGMPGEASIEALRSVLGDAELDVRCQAAISLARLGDRSGAAVLRDMTGLEIYEAARAQDPRKFASVQLVQQLRVTAVQALAGLDLAEDRAILEALASDEPDLLVREAAMRAIAE